MFSSLDILVAFHLNLIDFKPAARRVELEHRLRRNELVKVGPRLDFGRERRVGAILSSHIFEDVEHACDDVLILRAGRVVFHGPLDGEQLPSLRDLYFSYGGQ